MKIIELILMAASVIVDVAKSIIEAETPKKDNDKTLS